MPHSAVGGVVLVLVTAGGVTLGTLACTQHRVRISAAAALHAAMPRTRHHPDTGTLALSRTAAAVSVRSSAAAVSPHLQLQCYYTMLYYLTLLSLSGSQTLPGNVW